MRYKFLTGLTLLAVSALCLSLKAQSRQDFSYTLQLDSLAELRFAEGDMRGSICLWLEAAGIADHCAKTEEDSLIYSGFLQSLGVCYRRISMMDSTLHYYNMAWEIIQDKTSPAAVSEKTRLLTSMAILMTFMGRDEESVQFADRAMVMAGEATDIEMVMYAATNAGGIYARNGDFTKSASALRMAVSKTKENGMTDRLLSALTIMTSMFSLAGEKDSVSHYLAMAEEVAAELPENSVAVLGFRETQASVLGSLGRYAESNAIYRRLLSASGSNSSVAEDAGYIAMARNYMAMGQWENAGQCYERAYSVLDSIYSEDITAQVSEWSAKYGAAEKELEISRLEQESLKKQAAIKTWVIIAMALVAVLTGVVLTAAFRRRHLKKAEELRLARKYIDGVEKERARVARDLHDGICNDLLGIGMQISAMRPCSPEQDKVLSMLEGLRSEVRTISHDMMPPQFSFSGIEEVIEMYADRFRSQTRASILFKAVCDGSRTWRQIPDRISHEVYRIFQEHMGNIVKHSDAERIDAELRLSDSSLTLTVSDYGKHSGPDIPDKGGVGLKVMSERARSIEAVISYHSADGANIFKLNVPLTDL
jgi:signal transduction histidine kinase